MTALPIQPTVTRNGVSQRLDFNQLTRPEIDAWLDNLSDHDRRVYLPMFLGYILGLEARIKGLENNQNDAAF